MRVLTHLIVALIAINFSVNAISSTTIQCSKVKIKHGRVRMRTSSSKVVRFSCGKGYILRGIKIMACIRGFLEESPPVCVNSKPNCKPITSPINGFAVLESNGIVVHFICKPDYVLSGPKLTICDGNEWLYPAPTCIWNNQTEPSTVCNFEDEQICGWSHDLNHNFDWKRRTGQQRMGGPKYDHTLGVGNYMFVESQTRQAKDSSRLWSPIYPSFSQICLQFWYHMFGEKMGSLNVYIKEETGKGKLVFSISGNQGNEWHLASVNFENETQGPFQIIFEAIKGESFLSDVAIDDFSIEEAECPDLSSSTESSSTSVSSEDFSYDSCFNNCGVEVFSCSCSETCFERDNCCPDFIQYCFSGTSVDYDDIIATDSTTEITEFTTESESETETERADTSTTSTSTIILSTTETTPETTSTTETTIENKETTFFEYLKQTEIPEITETEKPQIQIKPPPNNVYIWFIAASLIFVTFSTVIVVTIRRKLYLNCSKFTNSRNNDSMSDVRFLASDEVLDFTWKRADSL